jgi:hypothetical protein
VQTLISSQRKRLTQPNQVLRPAHPVVADALVAAGNRLADVEPLVEHPIFLSALAAVAVALYAAASWGLV